MKAAGLPKVVSAQEWNSARAEFLVKEKAMTRARDALAAERRRLPMMPVPNYIFDAPGGKVSLLDLFDGRRQLLVYYFMFAPGVEGWPTAGCVGCSMFTDNIGQFTLTHLAARDVSFTLASRAPLENLVAYKQRMSWSAPWVSTAHNSFHHDFGLATEQGEGHQLNVFLRDGNNIYRTYSTQARGTEAVGNVWGFLEVTPFGRQEEWEDTPPGRPQSAPYQWWRRHDQY